MKSTSHKANAVRVLLGAGAAALLCTSAPVFANGAVQHEHHHYYHNGQGPHAPQCNTAPTRYGGQPYYAPHGYAYSPAPAPGGYGYGSPPARGWGHGHGRYAPSYGRGYAGNGITVKNAIGGAIGGWAGSQVGSGSGQLAATAIGTLLGYGLGNRF
ncbi:MAG: glycine zipper 2TM domain-containing protein [Pseudomonadota bacterium]